MFTLHQESNKICIQIIFQIRVSEHFLQILILQKNMYACMTLLYKRVRKHSNPLFIFN